MNLNEYGKFGFGGWCFLEMELMCLICLLFQDGIYNLEHKPVLL